MEIFQVIIEFFVDLFTAIGVLTNSLSHSSFNAVGLAELIGNIGKSAQNAGDAGNEGE